MSTLTNDEIARFEYDGILHLPGAIPCEATAPMRALMWKQLAYSGLVSSDPSTWKNVSNEKLREVNRSKVFRHIDSPRLHGAIDDLVGAGRWQVPANWGMFRMTAPQPGPAWEPTSNGWHSDCLPSDNPRQALFMLIHIGETPPGGGGTLLIAGSHRRLARCAAELGAAGNNPSRKRLRKRFRDGSPWLRKLMGEEPADRPRAEYFAEPSPPDEHGECLRLVEAHGAAGDVYLCHPLMYHATSDNRSSHMRLMRLKMLELDPGYERDQADCDVPLSRCLRSVQHHAMGHPVATDCAAF